MFDKKSNKRIRNKNDNGSFNNNEKKYQKRSYYNNNNNVDTDIVSNKNNNCYTNENFVHESKNMMTYNNNDCKNDNIETTNSNTNEMLHDDSIIYHSNGYNNNNNNVNTNSQDASSNMQSITATTATIVTKNTVGNVAIVNDKMLSINTNIHDNNSSGYSECNSSESSSIDSSSNDRNLIRYQTDIIHTPLQQHNIYSTYVQSEPQTMDYEMQRMDDTNIDYDCTTFIHHPTTNPYYVWQTNGETQNCHEYAIQQSPAPQTAFYSAAPYTAVPCVYGNIDSPYQNLIQPAQTYSPVSSTTISNLATPNLSSSPNVYAHYQTQQHYLTASPNPAAHLTAHLNSPTPTQVAMVATAATPYTNYATNSAIPYTPQIQTLLPLATMTPSPVPSSVFSSPYLMSPKSDNERIRYTKPSNNNNNNNNSNNNNNYNSYTFPKNSKRSHQYYNKQQTTMDDSYINDKITNNNNNNNNNNKNEQNLTITNTTNNTNYDSNGHYTNGNNTNNSLNNNNSNNNNNNTNGYKYKHKTNYCSNLQNNGYNNNSHYNYYNKHQYQHQQQLNETQSYSPQSSQPSSQSSSQQSSQSSVTPSILDNNNSIHDNQQLSQTSSDDGNKHLNCYNNNNNNNNQMVEQDTDDTDDKQLACRICRGRRMCFCYFIKVKYFKFPSFIDYMDYEYKKARNYMIKARKTI